MLDYLAPDLGYTPPELTQKYRRLRHVFDKAKRAWSHDEEKCPRTTEGVAGRGTEGQRGNCTSLSASDAMKQTQQNDGFDQAVAAFLREYPEHMLGFVFLRLPEGEPEAMILAFEAGQCFIAWLSQNYPLKDPKKEPHALSFLYHLMHTRQAFLIGEMNRGRMHGKHTTP